MSHQFPNDTSLRIATIGMDDRMRELMRMAFQGPGKGSYQLSSIENSDIFIFNMDNAEAKKLWSTIHRSYPYRPVVVLALKDPDIANTIYLEKPFRVEKLFDTLSAIKKKIISNAPPPKTDTSDDLGNISPIKQTNDAGYDGEREFCGAQPDFDLSNPNVVDNIYYKPNEYLQEQIAQAARLSRTDKVAVQIAVKLNDKWELATFLPTLQGVFTTLSEFQLRVICTAPKYCTEIKIHRYSPEETAILENGPKTKTSVQARDPFLWKVALWTSRGRIPANTSLSTPVRLARWPNLTRLQTTPNCMRIATLLMDEARPLRVVAKVLNIPQRHVFAFFSACQAVGIINQISELANGGASSTPGQKHKQHGLLSRILKRLTGAIAS